MFGTHRGQITDAPIYLEDKEMVGFVEEFNVPELESQMIEHDTLGSVGVLKLPRRGLSALDGSLVTKWVEPKFLALSRNPRKAALFQMHSKLDRFDAMGLDEAASETLITIVTVLFSKGAFPNGKKGEEGKDTADFSCTRLVQRTLSDATPIVEIDLFANIHRVMGEDVWPR